MSKTVLFQTIQSSICIQFTHETVLFQAIQFCISTQFSSIWPIDRAQWGATSLRERWPGSDGNEEVLCIPQSSRITGTSPSDCLVSYPGHTLVRVLPLCRGAISVFYSNWARTYNILHIQLFFMVGGTQPWKVQFPFIKR